MNSRGIFIILISFLVFFSLMLEALGAESRSLNRTDDPVVVPGRDIESLLGCSIERLSLMRWSKDRWEPVPFQVDEKNEKDEFIWKDGDVITRDEVPGFDANDELVFMVSDAGDRAPEGKVPSGAEKGVGLELADPLDETCAWVYLFSFSENAPRSEKDYVKMSLDRAEKVARVDARTYVIESVADAVYYNYLSLIHSDGTKTADLIDRLKIRGIISMFFGRLKVPFNFDQLVKSRITAWTDGQVRGIRRGEGYLDVPGIELKGEGYSVSYYYPDFFIYPMTLDIPLDLKTLLTDLELHGATDFTQAAYGWHYYDEYNPWNRDVVLDGKMSRAELNMNYSENRDWHVNTGKPGTFLHRIFFPEKWGFITKGLFYVDNAELEDPPEDNAGLIATGYNFERFIDLKKGSATYWMHYYFPQDFEPGDESRILNILDHPVRVKARALQF
jgi:hypothetical protein